MYFMLCTSVSKTDMWYLLIDSNPGELVIPLGRVKRIAKLDPDVKAINPDACVCITKVN